MENKTKRNIIATSLAATMLISVCVLDLERKSEPRNKKEVISETEESFNLDNLIVIQKLDEKGQEKYYILNRINENKYQEINKLFSSQYVEVVNNRDDFNTYYELIDLLNAEEREFAHLNDNQLNQTFLNNVLERLNNDLVNNMTR